MRHEFKKLPHVQGFSVPEECLLCIKYSSVINAHDKNVLDTKYRIFATMEKRRAVKC